MTLHDVDPCGDVIILLYPGPSNMVPLGNTLINELPYPPPTRPTSGEAAKTPPPPPTHEAVRYRVSSRHLSLASTQFQKRLQSCWQEGQRLRDDRQVELPVADWDAEAFLILMNIFHGRNRSVPRALSLELLTKVSILVDYYDCPEAVELFADLWLKELETKSFPPSATRSRDAVLWVMIAHVFQRPEKLRIASKIASTLR